ncbi:MAG: transglycosylase domain-containing protein [bacterium]|nr:transglycosylase domain-containing protein [bacterium]
MAKKSRVQKNTFTTRKGKSIKVRRSLFDRNKMRKDGSSKRKAVRLAGAPKGRVQRFLWILHPSRLYAYWVSREGAVMALKLMGISFIFGFLFLVGVFSYFRKDLPDLRTISGYNLGGSIQYYDNSGKVLLWEDYDAVKRTPVEYDQISQNMKDATISAEDKEFFEHGGFDLKGISRAAYNNVVGGSTQGGSTITQQLVKLTQNWSEERTVTRKIKEVILAVELERSYTKEEILNGYLNTAPYGNVQYGVETATRDYFQKSAIDLTIDEAAFLAAMPKSPSYYSPYGPIYEEEALVGRQHYIIDQMHDEGYITNDERNAAKDIKTVSKVHSVVPKFDGIKAPWFVLTAKGQLEEQFGEETIQRGGWKVTTTLDLELQKIAEEEINNGVIQVRNQGGDVASTAVEEVETGKMRALVGGSDFTNKDYGQNNYARLRLPPGSSFKPYDYIAMMENTNNTGAGSVLYDTQGPLEGYPCTNKNRPDNGGNCLFDYDFRYPGPLSLRYALGGSRNVPAIKAMLIAGIDKTIETAESLGLKSGYKCFADDMLTKESQCYASSAIGDGAFLRLDEHVHAQASISRGGVNIPQTYIEKIIDSGGKPVWEWKKEKGEQVIRPDTAYIISDMLSDPRASYMSKKSHDYNGWNFALKTGTTNDNKDGWLTGYSTKYSTSVWVGHHTRRVELSGFMESMTQPIWSGIMTRIHDGKEPVDWQRPAGVQELPAYVVRNHVGVSSIEPSPSTDLFPSWYKKPGDVSQEKVVIDKVSKKRATECTPDLAKEETREASADKFSSDPFSGVGGANTDEDDDIHKCNDKKPGINLVVTPKGGNNYTVSASVSQGTHPLDSSKFKGKVDFSVGGDVIKSFGIQGSYSFSYKANFTGSKVLTATVVDSVLYSASDEATITSTGSFTVNNPGSPSGGTTTISWIGGTAPYKVYVDGSVVPTCNGVSSNSCVVPTPGPKGTVFVVKVEDDDGETASTTFTKG